MIDQTTRFQPQIDPRTRHDSEAYEDAVELQRALAWAAEHADEALFSVAELREMGRAA